MPAAVSSATASVAARPLLVDSLIKRTIEDIALIKRQTAIAFAFAVGEIVVNNFFHGDLEQVAYRGPKAVSLRALGEHPDLPLSRRALFTAVEVYGLLRRAGGVRAFVHLGYSHFQAALPAAVQCQQTLLAQADAEKWSVRRLKDEVANASAHGRPRGGRRAASTLSKALRTAHLGVLRAAELCNGDDAVPPVESAQLPELITALETLVTRLKRCAAMPSTRAAGSADAGEPCSTVRP